MSTKVTLYVEDDPDIQMIAELALEDTDYELHTFSSGKDAIEQAEIIKPNLFLLDVMMPEIDGPTTLQKLRENILFKNTPAIFMTAKVQSEEQASYLSLGAIGVISKPFDPLTLPDQIDMILENHQRVRQEKRLIYRR